MERKLESKQNNLFFWTDIDKGHLSEVTHAGYGREDERQYSQKKPPSKGLHARHGLHHPAPSHVNYSSLSIKNDEMSRNEDTKTLEDGLVCYSTTLNHGCV